MNSNKYLLIFCIVLVLIVASVKDINSRLPELNRAVQLDRPVGTLNNRLDSSILLDDHEQPITAKKTEIKEPAKIVIKPYITAESYLVANLETGERYLQYNPSKVFPIASVSKLYTSLVVKHILDPNISIAITQPMLDAYGDSGGLKLDERYNIGELLHSLLLVSSNDAAEAFAYSYGYDKFIESMNAFAQEIGMSNTSFKDPSGLSSGNISNANDLFILAKYLYRSEPDILRISRVQQIDIATTTTHGSNSLININPFVTYPEFIGGKTGRTNEAKEAMVTLFDKKIGNKRYPIAVIILRSDFGEREINTEKLLGQFIDKVGDSR